MLYKNEEVSPYLLQPLRSFAEVESERRARSVHERTVPIGLVKASSPRKAENDDSEFGEPRKRSWWRALLRRSRSVFDT